MRWQTFANGAGTSTGRHAFEAEVEGGRYQLMPLDGAFLKHEYVGFFCPTPSDPKVLPPPVMVCTGFDLNDSTAEVYAFEERGRKTLAQLDEEEEAP